MPRKRPSWCSSRGASEQAILSTLYSPFLLLQEFQVALIDHERFDLGGRLKTGHTWTLQNRPTELNQNKSIYTLETGTRARIFSRVSPAGLY
jgi:hypothetical protein